MQATSDRSLALKEHSIDGLLRPGQEVQRVYDVLLEEIVSGALWPGTKLGEPSLALRLGTSRGPVREAIRRLEERQLVQCIPNLGARVIVHSPADIIEAYELREALEGLAARLAAQNMTDGEIADLRKLFEEETVQRCAAGVARSFHAPIIVGSRNRRIAQLINEDFARLLRLWRRTCPWLCHGTEHSRSDHGRILDAIEHRDPEFAETLMRRHLRRLREASLINLGKLEATGQETGASFKRSHLSKDVLDEPSP